MAPGVTSCRPGKRRFVTKNPLFVTWFRGDQTDGGVSGSSGNTGRRTRRNCSCE
jgi:hypothetical protein